MHCSSSSRTLPEASPRITQASPACLCPSLLPLSAKSHPTTTSGSRPALYIRLPPPPCSLGTAMAHQRQASASLAHQRNASGHLRQRHGSDSFRADDYKPGRRSVADRRSSRTDGSYIADDDTDHHAAAGAVREEDDWSLAAAENGSMPKPKHLRHTSSTAYEQRPGTLTRQRSEPKTPTLASSSNVETVTPIPPPAPTWMNMPNKGQLAILAASRFVDFFQSQFLRTSLVANRLNACVTKFRMISLYKQHSSMTWCNPTLGRSRMCLARCQRTNNQRKSSSKQKPNSKQSMRSNAN